MFSDRGAVSCQSVGQRVSESIDNGHQTAS